ncbi:MAG: chromosomal replication initiator protein DnaA, partial [Kofleriaceae bacterium]|nr:chromosomal replication initiator protein DnaA [Kofleriaceae bacterium]
RDQTPMMGVRLQEHEASGRHQVGLSNAGIPGHQAQSRTGQIPGPAAAAPSDLSPSIQRRADTPIQPPMTDNIINVALNPRYNFKTFISGPSNQLAFAAAQSCANSYPPKYNPVFICGGVGLGKTHLLHAIGHQIMRNRPSAKLCYITGERFMNEYVHAIRTNQMHEFRHRYRENCDVLLVDDVQFLAGKDGTQDEFFHTFNALHDSHRQIVLTADRKPHEISDIADRLRSRFAWGLLADIEPPELEVRMAILTEKAAAENIHLPDSVSMYIATSIKSNVRELEGALIRLAAYSSLSRKEITLEFARETLEGSITRPPEHMTVDTILKCVAGYYGVKVSDLKSVRRHKSISGPRAVAMYLARTHTKESYPDLGRSFGGKHHTTVISAVDKITKKLVDDNALRGEINAIENNLLR